MGEDRCRQPVEVNFEFTNDGMVPSVQTDIRITHVVLKWRQKITNEMTVYYGDHFERSYGDLSWRPLDPDRKMFWYFLSSNNILTKGYGVKTLPNAACIWYVDNEFVTLEMDIRSGSYGVNLKGRKLDLCEIVEYESSDDAFNVYNRFCGKMCNSPVIPKEHVYGTNTWYNTYGENMSNELVLEYTNKLMELTEGNAIKPYMVIDDGWQLASIYQGSTYKFTANGGPWRPHKYFGDMGQLATKIKEKGAKPGIWIRPLLSANNVSEELLLYKQLNGDDLQYVLDPTHPKVLEAIGADIRLISSEWGYQLIKHDFSTYDIYGQWGFEIAALNREESLQSDKRKIRFYNDSITTIEAVKGLYQVIRNNKGDDCIILGCNTISHLSAGIFEVCRTGDDTSGYEFARTRKMGVNVMAFRLPQHNRFYLTDADCIGIKSKPKGIEWKQNKEWLELLAKSGTPLFFSVDFDELDLEKKKDLREAMKINLKADPSKCIPLDWKYRNYPERWSFDNGNKTFDWYME